MVLSAAPATSTLLVQARVGLAPSSVSAWIAGELPNGATVSETHVPGLYEIEAPTSQLAKLTNHFRASTNVAYAEKAINLQIQAVPNDPRYGELYGLKGAFGIKAEQAWDISTGSTAVTVAVIDSGVDYNHPDLYRNIWINQAEIPASARSAIQSVEGWDVDNDGLITFWDLNDTRNQGTGKIVDFNIDGRITGADLLRPFSLGGWVDGVNAGGDTFLDDIIGWNFINNTNNPMDDNSHGTHVAGTIGAVGNNGVGVVGVNWRTQIMGLKFLSASGNGSDAGAAAAIRYAVDHGAPISNNSYGGGGISSTLTNAITYASQNNHLVVAAAGNDNRNTDITPSYPASLNLPNIISVASTSDSGVRSSFSNYGLTTVDLGAPGSAILSTVPGGGYSSFDGTSMASPHVAGAAALLLSQYPGLTYTQIIDTLFDTVTPFSWLASITATGGLLNIFAAMQDAPEIRVLQGATNLRDASSTVAFGSTFAGTSTSKTFTVKNVGHQPLVLSEPISVPNGFSLASSFAATTVAPGASTTFVVRFDATEAGSYSGTLSFGNNDANEGLFEIALTGTVVSKLIIDNGDAGFATSGSWTATGQGFQGDGLSGAPGGKSPRSATWTFAVTPGVYRVSATWVAGSTRATNAPFSVLENGVVQTLVRLNQQASPNDLSDAGAAWEDIASNISIFGTNLVVRLTNDANQLVIADAIRIERVGNLPSGPEIQVQNVGADIADGATTIDFGSTSTGTPVSKTFTVRNLGTQNLTLGSVDLPAGFTVTSPFGTTTLAPGAATTFTVRLDAGGAGSYSGQIVFVTNDPDEDPFNFTIQGSVTPPPAIQIIDNGNTGFTSVGGWTPATKQGYLGDIHSVAAGDGTKVATWTFAVTPGVYRIAATWTAGSNRASDAPFTVLDGADPLGTVRLSQLVAPNDFSYAGVNWENFGTDYIIYGNTLVVKLANNANQTVIADAIRIERVGDLPSA